MTEIKRLKNVCVKIIGIFNEAQVMAIWAGKEHRNPPVDWPPNPHFRSATYQRVLH